MNWIENFKYPGWKWYVIRDSSGRLSVGHRVMLETVSDIKKTENESGFVGWLHSLRMKLCEKDKLEWVAEYEVKEL